MNFDDLDKITETLSIAHCRKRDILLAKANAEIAAIQREDAAYYDGAYDAIKRVKELLRGQEG